MMVSAMFRALSKALSCRDRGSDFMFLRTRVEQRQPAAQQVFGQLLADRALVAEQLADQVAGQRWNRLAVMDIAGGQLQGDDLMAVVEDEVQFEAEAPPHRGPAQRGRTYE